MYRTCPHCDGRYERLVEGVCPHCEKEIPRKRRPIGSLKITRRTCPSCKHKFSKAKLNGKVRHCPNCDTALHYLKSDTILYSDKEAAAALVSNLQNHISKRSGARWPFEFRGSELARELVHGYSILNRAKSDAKKRGLQVAPEKLAALFVDDALSNGCGGADSLALIRGNIAKISNRVCRVQAATESVNASMESSPDFSGFTR